MAEGIIDNTAYSEAARIEVSSNIYMRQVAVAVGLTLLADFILYTWSMGGAVGAVGKEAALEAFYFRAAVVNAAILIPTTIVAGAGHRMRKRGIMGPAEKPEKKNEDEG
ncbi:MAG: hypothetical protein AAB955_02330 [Patescibacteria group bacterium]